MASEAFPRSRSASGDLALIDHTPELRRRPTRAPDYRAENEALAGLAQAVADAPTNILQAVADTLVRTLRAGSCGVCLVSANQGRLQSRWAALAGLWNSGAVAVRAGCGLSELLDRDRPVLLRELERRPELAQLEPRIEECLVVPLRLQRDPVGTIWVVAHEGGRRFDGEDLRLLESLARFAGSAYQIGSTLGTAGPLAAIVESSDDAILSKDLNSLIRTWNAGAQKLFGYTAQEAIGRPVTILIPPERSKEEPDILELIRSGKRVEHYETVRQRKDGTRVDVSLTVSPLFDARGRVVGASKIARDITARKRAEEALRQSEERLRRLAADLSETDRRKDEFLAMLAHELRNPLAPIVNAIRLARATHGEGEAFEWILGTLERQSDQLVRITDDLLDVSRISRGMTELRREHVVLSGVIEHAVESVQAKIEASGQELRVELPPRPVHLHADPVRLAQALGNLLDNAAKFTARGGHIGLTASRQGAEAIITVSDDGAGIPADQLERIFELFVQVDTSLERRQHGLGIGLTVARRLIEMHGGTVIAESDDAGHGSRFTVRLPILEENSDMPQSQSPAESGKSLSGRRILIVDDNRDAATSLGMLLELSGDRTETAFDGPSAIEAAARFQPDVILLDIGLPGLNGYEVARRMRSEPWGRQVKLIAVTGWGQVEDRQRSKEAGFDAHLVKPVDHAVLVKLLADVEGKRG